MGKIAVYFALLAAWCAGSALFSASPRLWYSMVALIVLGTISVALLCLFAWLVARTTVYTLTERRLVLRIGVAMSVSINLPFRSIESASVRLYPDGSGDIPVLLAGPTRMGITVLWPHVRPWRLQRVQPMMRMVPDAARVANLLSRALTASANQAAQPAPEFVPAASARPVRAEAHASVGA